MSPTYQCIKLLDDKTFIYNDGISNVIQYVFHYDIKSAAPRILKELNIDLPNNFKDKLERNVYVGNLFKQNRELYKLYDEKLRYYVKSFLQVNQVSDDDIIAIERDGIYTTKYCTEYDNEIYPELREFYHYFIISYKSNRQFMMITDEKVKVKGIKNKTLNLEKFLTDNLLALRYNDIKNWNSMLNEMRIKYFNSTDLNLFLVKIDDNNYKLYLSDDKKHSHQSKIYSIDIKKKYLSSFSRNQNIYSKIAKFYYYSIQIETFIQSILTYIL